MGKICAGKPAGIFYVRRACPLKQPISGHLVPFSRPRWISLLESGIVWSWSSLTQNSFQYSSLYNWFPCFSLQATVGRFSCSQYIPRCFSDTRRVCEPSGAFVRIVEDSTYRQRLGEGIRRYNNENRGVLKWMTGNNILKRNDILMYCKETIDLVIESPASPPLCKWLELFVEIWDEHTPALINKLLITIHKLSFGDAAPLWRRKLPHLWPMRFESASNYH